MSHAVVLCRLSSCLHGNDLFNNSSPSMMFTLSLTCLALFDDAIIQFSKEKRNGKSFFKVIKFYSVEKIKKNPCCTLIAQCNRDFFDYPADITLSACLVLLTYARSSEAMTTLSLSTSKPSSKKTVATVLRAISFIRFIGRLTPKLP